MGAQFSKGGLHNINWLSLPTLFFPLRLKFLELGEKSKRGKKNIKWEKSKPIYFNWHLLAYWNGTFIYLVWDHWCMYMPIPCCSICLHGPHPTNLNAFQQGYQSCFAQLLIKDGAIPSLLVFQSLMISWTQLPPEPCVIIDAQQLQFHPPCSADTLPLPIPIISK